MKRAFPARIPASLRTLALALVLGAAASHGAENYSLWSGMRTYTINTSATGVLWVGTATNFPLLVRLGANDSVFTQAKADGSDLRFTKADSTTRLSHEIEHWDTAAKTAAIWVLIDSVKGNLANQTLLMRWGKSDAADSSNAAAVFSPSNGYVGVWHMSGTADETDVTGNGNDAAAENAPGSAAGQIGKGRTLSRDASQHFIVADDASLNFTTPALTMSAWVNAADWNGSSRIFQKGEGGDAAQYGLRETSLDRFAIDVSATNLNDATSAVPEIETWALVHAMIDATTRRAYLNGAEILTGEYPGDDIATTTVPLHLGHQPGGANYFNGIFDEMRIQNVARSADWAILEYENQKTGQNLVQIVPPGGGIVGVANHASGDAAAFSATIRGHGAVFRITGASAASVVVSDVHGRIVWNGAFAPGAGTLVWDGRGSSQGVYVARVSLRDNQGRITTAQRRFSLTR